jgi:uncharacterized protein involved in outer membrane biogenesis
MRRRVKIGLGVIAGVVALPAAALLVLVPRLDLAGFAAARASAALGREVTIGSLRIVPGLPTRITLRDARLANIAGGSSPEMARVARLDAVLSPLPLLRGRVALQDVAAEGVTLLLERAPDRRANWRFGAGAPSGGAASALILPGLLRLANAEVVFRTTGGALLTTRIEQARLDAAPAGRPASLDARGSYNGVPLRLEGALFSADALRAGGALPVTLRATAEETALLFEGTSTDPLDADGLDGRITFAASSPRAVLAMAGVAGGPEMPVEFAGRATRQGDVWRLEEVAGTLDGSDFEAALLQLTEGAAGRPDAIVARLGFARLDLTRLSDALDGGAADAPFVAPAAPDPLIRAEVTARAFTHDVMSGSDATARLEVAPGRIALDIGFAPEFGGRLSLAGEMLAAADGARAEARGEIRAADLDGLRRTFGIHGLPVEGPVDVDLAVVATGATLAEARRGARISGVVRMSGGTIAREVIEMASTDLRALFRTSRGRTRLTCLLAAVDIRGGEGEAAPLRIRAGTGTVAGLARFDLNRRVLDLVIGSERATTDVFALDIPVRVHGSFADPEIVPAEWSRTGRARLAQGALAPLPPDLMDLARQSPCHAGRSLRR